MTQSRLPEGWDEERVQRVLSHYESQTEDEAVAEDEAAFEDQMRAFAEVPFKSVTDREFSADHRDLIILGTSFNTESENKEWRGLGILPFVVTSAS